MTVKYRVTDLAKDFGLSSNNITDILLRLSDTPKKSQTALSEEELDLKANQWELSHGGISGRSAQQFINYLAGQAGE